METNKNAASNSISWFKVVGFSMITVGIGNRNLIVFLFVRYVSFD